MHLTSGCKAKVWRFWAELLTIRDIAGHSVLWRTVSHLAGRASDGCIGPPSANWAIKTILDSEESLAKLAKELRSNCAVTSEGARVRADCGSHPQWPGRRFHQVLLRGSRGPSRPGHRHWSR